MVPYRATSLVVFFNHSNLCKIIVLKITFNCITIRCHLPAWSAAYPSWSYARVSPPVSVPVFETPLPPVRQYNQLPAENKPRKCLATLFLQQDCGYIIMHIHSIRWRTKTYLFRLSVSPNHFYYMSQGKKGSSFPYALNVAAGTHVGKTSSIGHQSQHLFRSAYSGMVNSNNVTLLVPMRRVQRV